MRLPAALVLVFLCKSLLCSCNLVQNGQARDSSLRRRLDACDSIDPPSPHPTDVPAYSASAGGAVSGERRKWHKITVGFRGPQTCETHNVNPFTYYRLDVTFSHAPSGKVYVVPGYYAADGNAANTGASAGNVWLVHFTPSETGLWDWSAEFTSGSNVAQNGGGSSAGFMDGLTGSFTINNSNKGGRDLRGKGMLEYVGEHHLRFAEGEWFLKAGADSPENLLAYEDFDNTPNFGGLRKTWAPHAGDYVDGQPTWGGGKGTEILGAINYLSDKGMNAFSFLTMNINGDDKNVFPYVSDDAADRTRIDVSKTAQWEILFEHADHMGLFMHFKTQEIENNHLLDDGNLRLERKLYYRELIARFSHHLALNWNLGEENENLLFQRRQFAEFFKENDPYDHPVVIHTWPTSKEEVYGPLLGNEDFDGASLQSETVFEDTLEWVTRSAESGHKWVVANDEQNPFGTGVRPDTHSNHAVIRKEFLYANIMAGGAGVEYYFGYQYDCNDLTCQDYSTREDMWRLSRIALEFFDDYVPFWNMYNDDSIVGLARNRCLRSRDDGTFVVYLPEGGTDNIDLPGASWVYSVDWYNPRAGGLLQSGSVSSLSSGNNRDIGIPPTATTSDWLALIRRQGGAGGGASPTSAPEVPTPAPTPVVNTDLAIRKVWLLYPDNSFEELLGGEVFTSDILDDGGLRLWAATDGAVESVRFVLDGIESIDNTASYRMSGLDEVRTYEIEITPFAGDDGAGQRGETVAIEFAIGDGTEPPPGTSPPTATPVDISVARIWLQYPDNSFAAAVVGGEVFSSDILDNGALTLWAVMDGAVESVRFVVDGVENIDSTSPFRIFDLGEERTYVIEITPFTGVGGTGQSGETVTVAFTIGSDP